MRNISFTQNPSQFKTAVHFRQLHVDTIEEMSGLQKLYFTITSLHGKAFRIAVPFWREFTGLQRISLTWPVMWSIGVLSMFAD